MGAIVHVVANRALSNHTAKNIFGNVNYAKHFFRGTVVGFFDGRTPGGKNAVWKLTVDFKMPSDGAKVELKKVVIHRQHCKATTKKKKASKTVNLRENPVWVVPTDGKRHRVVAIAHEQKWVAGVAAMITGNVTDEHTSIHQWCHKDPFSKRIAPGNLEHSIMSPLQAFLHMMPPVQLTLMLEPTNMRLVEKEKQEMTRQ